MAYMSEEGYKKLVEELRLEIKEIYLKMPSMMLQKKHKACWR
jgi:hypothetical protein